jgi:hypothetical protein
VRKDPRGRGQDFYFLLGIKTDLGDPFFFVISLTGIFLKYEERRSRVMRRWVSIFLVFSILTVFSFGCAGIQKDTKIKCPKCGAVFTSEEGVEEFQMK